MTSRIANRLTRIRRYFDRVRTDISNKDCPQAMADTAELDYQVQALYKDVQKYYHEIVLRRTPQGTMTEIPDEIAPDEKERRESDAA